MQQDTYESESVSETRTRILAHPLVPPNPYTPAMSLPRLPSPVLIDREARPSENREFLIEAYTSASRAFYPQHAVASACKFMRSVDGRRLLDAAAATFLRNGIAPQAWLGLAFQRELKRRKQPMRPEQVYEPTLIEKGVGAYQRRIDEAGFFQRPPVRDARHEVYIRGIRDLCSLWDRTIADLRKLDRYDETAIARICTRYWPTGYASIYRHAEDKMRSIQNELDVRAHRGEYIWGL